MTNLELREAVAVRVVGWTLHERPGEGWFARTPRGNGDTITYVNRGALISYLPAYESNIAAAWQVVERMAATPGRWLHSLGRASDRQFVCVFGGDEDMGLSAATGYADTAPEAICRAALAAIEESGDA